MLSSEMLLDTGITPRPRKARQALLAFVTSPSPFMVGYVMGGLEDFSNIS